MRIEVHTNRTGKDSEVSVHETTDRVAGGQQGVYNTPNIQVDSPLWYYMPPAPQNLVVTGKNVGTVDLDWDNVTEDFDSYTVYVQNNDTGELEQTISGLSLSETQVTGLSDVEYEFWVTATEGITESIESNHVTAHPQPAAPANFSVEVIEQVIGTEYAAYLADDETIYSNGDILSTVTDQIGGSGSDLTNVNNDLFYTVDSVNGHNAYESDTASVNAECQGTFGSTLSQPLTIGIIARVDTGNNGAMLVDGGSQGQVRVGSFNNFEALINAGGGSISSSVVMDDSVYKAYLAIVNGADSELWINNTLEASGDPGSNGLTGLSLFCSGDGFQDVNGAIAEVRLYDEAFTSEQVTLWFNHAEEFLGVTF